MSKLSLQQTVSAALQDIGLPAKPDYTEPCNHCGLCCTMSLCPVAEEVFAGDSSPCKALEMDSGKAVCGLVAIEMAAGMDNMIGRILGVGCGCSMPDEDTTDQEIDHFNALSEERVVSHG